MNKSKTETSGTTTAVAEPKRYDEAFKRQTVEHWLRSGQGGTKTATSPRRRSRTSRRARRRSFAYEHGLQQLRHRLHRGQRTAAGERLHVRQHRARPRHHAEDGRAREAGRGGGIGGRRRAWEACGFDPAISSSRFQLARYDGSSLQDCRTHSCDEKADFRPLEFVNEFPLVPKVSAVLWERMREAKLRFVGGRVSMGASFAVVVRRRGAGVSPEREGKKGPRHAGKSQHHRRHRPRAWPDRGDVECGGFPQCGRAGGESVSIASSRAQAPAWTRALSPKLQLPPCRYGQQPARSRASQTGAFLSWSLGTRGTCRRA